MTLKQHENYKPSGVEWLGAIPHHWAVKRVKDISQTQSGTTPTTNVNSYYENGIHNWIRTTDLNDGKLYEVEYKITDLAIMECRLKFLPIDTILVAMYGGFGTIGKNSILKKESTINQSVCAILPNAKYFNSDYFLYFLKYFRHDWKLFADGTRKDPNINQDAVKNLFFIYPTLPEQNEIAHYLDQKTTAIDRKINLLEKKIDRYQALRKSLINETVCRGLDKSVKLKESGIEWIGQVPEHWQPVRLKDIGFLYSGLSGKSGDDFNQEDNLNNRGFIPFTNIANNIYLDKNQLGTVIVFDNEKQNQVRKNDLFFLMSSEGYADIGKTAVLADEIKETYLNSFCKGFRVSNKNNDSYFINYLLLSPNYRHSMIVEGKGFTRINLKMEKVNDYFIYIPPSKSEQTAISTYLDEKTQKIDTIISNIKTQIEVLKELRKTLINDVVTGKIRVDN